MMDRNLQVFSVTLHELTDAAPHSQHLLSVLFQELSLLAQHFLLARRPKHDTDACCSLSMIHILIHSLPQSSVACCGVQA